MKRILISGILIGLFITLGTIGAILYATGYRFELNGDRGSIRFIEGTGILVATSRPDGARIYVDNKLTTATNNTINLAPEQYDVRIEKDGYIPWAKKIVIQKGLVSEANALLIPVAPKLEAVTTIGVSNVVIDRSESLLAYTVASSSATRNGIYILDMNSRNLIFLAATGTQIVGDTQAQFSKASALSFSPDGKELLVKLPNGAYYLLATDARNQNPQDVTNTLLAVQRNWLEQQQELDKKTMDSLSSKLSQVASRHFMNMKASPKDDKLLYTASISAQLPQVLEKSVPSLNSTTDQRNITAGNIYVYDIKEDKNYLIFDKAKLQGDPLIDTYFWHADSRHLIYARDGKVNVVEYDGGNLTTVYDGIFLDNLVFPWPDGSSIAIVSRLSASVPHNIYRISLQ